MPSRNLIRNYQENSFYHIYTRGVEKREIFLDDQDRMKFMNILEKYLTPRPPEETNLYDTFEDKIDINAYCLMGNHLHILLFMKDGNDGVTKLLRRVLTSYTMYFNRKYDRVGPLFQSKFKASLVDDESYLLHLSRYIHLNPSDYASNKFSSILHFLGKPSPEWLRPENVLAGMRPDEYTVFLQDYESEKQKYIRIREKLATIDD